MYFCFSSTTASGDLLGLSTPPTTQNSGNTSVLVDVLGDIYNSKPNTQQSAQATYDPKKFIFKNNGVLFENGVIQIGVKSEFRQNLGRLKIFYGNKTSFPLTNLQTTLVWSEEQNAKLNVQMKPVESPLEAGAQIQQILNAECIDDYTDSPSLAVSFTYSNMPQKTTIKLPLFLNKFFEPTEMNSESFFARWKNLGSINQQRSQRIFKANGPIDLQGARTKLQGFGMQLLDGIDPNPDNFVCAGIVHMRAQQVGCLLRLEPNKTAQMYRLTVRSSKESVSVEICDLLVDQF